MITQPSQQEISLYLQEDMGSGDITAGIIPETVHADATVITREDMVLCGQTWFNAVFKHLNPSIQINWLFSEGDDVDRDSVLCELQGPARALLSGERTALNLLQTLSATATVSRAYANAVAATACKVLDTRKTIPGLRFAQKYAVSCGGCFNHRIGLYDAVLIKENHIIAAGSIAKAIKIARAITNVLVEVEVEDMDEFKLALAARPDRIMLDNFSMQNMRDVEAMHAGGLDLEVSSIIDLENIRSIAETGVDYISIGALTKNIKAIDLSMRINLDSKDD